MIDITLFHKSSCHKGGRTVCIHMVRTVLRIVFQNDDDAFVPDRRFAEVFNEKSACKVIVSIVCFRCWLSHTETLGMVVRKPMVLNRGALPAASKDSKSFFHI